MAKIILSEKERRIDKLSRYVFGAIKVQGITQEQIANELGLARQTFNRKVKKGTLTFAELWKVFRLLGADADTILSILN